MWVRDSRRDLGKLVLALTAVVSAGACASNGPTSGQHPPGVAAASIRVASSPEIVIVSHDSRQAFVSYDATNTISVVDLASDKVVRTFHMKGQVSDMALSPNGQWLYVAIEYSESTTFDMQVIDTKADSTSVLLPLGGSAGSVSVSPGGQDVYVTLSTGTTTTHEELETIDLARRSVVNTMPIPGGSQLSEVAPDGQHLYLMTEPFTTFSATDQDQESFVGQLIVIDIVQHRIVGTIDEGSSSGCDLAVDPEGTEVLESFCSTAGSKSEPLGIRVYSTGTTKLLATIPMKYGGDGLAFSHDGRVLYAATSQSAIDLIDAQSNSIISSISVPELSKLGTLLGPIALSPNGRFACAGTRLFPPYELLVVPLSQN